MFRRPHSSNRRVQFVASPTPNDIRSDGTNRDVRGWYICPGALPGYGAVTTQSGAAPTPRATGWSDESLLPTGSTPRGADLALALYAEAPSFGVVECNGFDVLDREISREAGLSTAHSDVIGLAAAGSGEWPLYAAMGVVKMTGDDPLPGTFGSMGSVHRDQWLFWDEVTEEAKSFIYRPSLPQVQVYGSVGTIFEDDFAAYLVICEGANRKLWVNGSFIGTATHTSGAAMAPTALYVATRDRAPTSEQGSVAELALFDNSGLALTYALLEPVYAAMAGRWGITW